MAAYRVGLTGGVASGKSVVTQAFRDLGVAVVDADRAARDAVAPGTDGLADVVTAFGAGVLDATGALDRAAMRERVFGDVEARRRLEAIVHPRVRAALQAASTAAPGPYVVVAIPLLAEGGGRTGYPWLDRILVVDTPVATQLARLLRRDGIDAVLAERMIAAQAGRRDRLGMADDVLVNDGAIADLDAPIRALDLQYRLLASGSDGSL